MRDWMSVLAAAVALTVPGCASSPPTQFYTLEAVAPTHRDSANSREPVRVIAVHIPPVLDRDQIVRERSSSELDVSDTHRWGAPLPGMMRDVLTQDLALRLPEGSVVLPEQPLPPQTASITLDVLRLEAQTAGNISFEGGWSLVAAGSDSASLHRDIHIHEPATSHDYAAQAHAMSLALGQVADDIAAALRQP